MHVRSTRSASLSWSDPLRCRPGSRSRRCPRPIVSPRSANTTCECRVCWESPTPAENGLHKYDRRPRGRSPRSPGPGRAQDRNVRRHGRARDRSGWRGHAERWFTARIQNPGHCLYVVDADGRVASCALGSLSESQPTPARPFGQDLYISNVVTLPEFRGRGYAAAIFEAVLQWGRRQPGPVRARLFATADGRGMYERAGFVPNTWPVMGVDLTGGPTAEGG